MDSCINAFPTQDTSFPVCSAVFRNLNRDIWWSVKKFRSNWLENIQHGVQLGGYVPWNVTNGCKQSESVGTFIHRQQLDDSFDSWGWKLAEFKLQRWHCSGNVFHSQWYHSSWNYCGKVTLILKQLNC